MPEIEATIDFDVYCGTCGEALCGKTSVDPDKRYGHVVRVEACDKCLEKAHDEGYDDGYKQAQEDHEVES